MSLLFQAINGQIQTPNAISGLQRWYFASPSTITVESTNRVITLIDQSGNGRNATAATGSTARPTFNSNQISGQGALAFDGVANYLDGGTNADLVNTAAYTWIVVFSRAAYPGTTNFYEQILNLKTDLGTTFSVNFILTDMYSAYGKETLVGYGSSSIDIVGVNTSTTANQYYFAYSDYNGSGRGSAVNYSYALNNSSQTTSIAPNLWTPASANQYGRYPGGGGSGYFKGNIAEIIVYNKQLSASEKQLIKTYIHSKYNL